MKTFKVDWQRAYCEAYGLQEWEYDPEYYGFVVVFSSALPERDLIKLRDAITVQAKEQGIA